MIRPAPIIVSALFGPEDHRWLDDQRKAHFPVERNVLAAHLTLFHHLPPSIVDELCQRLRDECRAPAPLAEITSVISLGAGTAYRVRSPELEHLRERMASAFEQLLIPQDLAAWHPHVTIQNKVKPAAARALKTQIETEFRPRRIVIAGIAAWWYCGGPWEPIAAYRFGSGQKMDLPRH
jgi:2'-5' RNA ligase superfamily